MRLLDALLDFLFPPRCPACAAYVPARGGWCAACLREAAAPRTLPAAPAAGAARHPAVMEAVAIGRYEGVLGRLVKELKYHGKRSVLPEIRALLDAAPYAPPAGIDLACPVPLHREKEKARGFNQAEEIFRDWLAARAIPLARVLCRTRATPPLYGLGAGARRKSLKGAFALEAGADLGDRHILLVDDIFTTGATMEECRRTLLAAGARRVDFLALASDAGGASARICAGGM